MDAPIRAVVNADDLGMSDAVNDAIFELIEVRRVTSATLLANGPAIEAALERLRDFPQASFGVHLNATEFEPLVRETDLGPLLDGGVFAGNRVREVRLNARLQGALLTEFRAQVDRLRSHGVAPSHIDSHHHIHTIPALLPVLRQLCRDTGIRRVRNTRNLYTPELQIPPGLHLRKRIWSAALKVYVGARTTDLFGDLESFIARAPDLRGISTAEIMVHPGGADNADEGQTLRRTWWQGLPLDIMFINVNAL
jgi:predicted glycoside hydrolase/deacetylase ChbG (UPF0249 family)